MDEFVKRYEAVAEAVRLLDDAQGELSKLEDLEDLRGDALRLLAALEDVLGAWGREFADAGARLRLRA